MEHKEYLERRDKLTQMRTKERRENGSSGISALSIVGGLALVGIAALIVVSLPDIKRYIKISTM